MRCIKNSLLPVSPSSCGFFSLRLAFAWLACASCASRPHHPANDAEGVYARQRGNVDAARELDQEGVRGFREGRYADAIRYFRTAYALGGPPSELWNIAKCRERMDDAEGATAAIDEYLTVPNLSPQDRSDAEHEAQALRARPSILTVTSTPAGALVTVDGKQTGPTPLSVEIRPGVHTVVVRREGYSAATQSLEARFGRAVIVSLDLGRGAK